MAEKIKRKNIESKPRKKPVAPSFLYKVYSILEVIL